MFGWRPWENSILAHGETLGDLGPVPLPAAPTFLDETPDEEATLSPPSFSRRRMCDYEPNDGIGKLPVNHLLT